MTDAQVSLGKKVKKLAVENDATVSDSLVQQVFIIIIIS